MEEIFTIELPATLSREEVETLENDLRAVDGVDDAGSEDARSVDPLTLGVWVQLIGGLLGSLDSGASVVQKIAETIRGKGIKGAKIKFANGTTLSVDEISSKDLQKLMKDANH